jgi:penicillin-binding protein 1A
VWTGFDKPQKIYRGAFGRELALPVWVDIMNKAAEHYPPKEIARPPGLNEAEICARSGLLATDQCYDTIRNANGDVIKRRCTYMEIATSAQMPTEPCNVHGEPRIRIVREASDSDLPRAESAVDLASVHPVMVTEPTLLADQDPYRSVKPLIKPTPEPDPQTAGSPTPEKIEHGKPEESPIPKAQPVPPEEQEPAEIRKALPVGPLDEELDGTLLKNQTPPPQTSDDTGN